MTSYPFSCRKVTRSFFRSKAAWSPPMCTRIRWCPSVLGRRSVEHGAGGAGALQLVETGRPGHQHAAVPKPPGSLSLGRRGDDGAEERHAFHGDDGGADVLANQVDAALVARAQLLVDLRRRREPRQVSRQPDLLQGAADDDLVVLLAAEVDAVSHRVVQRLDHRVTVLPGGGDDDPDRAPG